MNVRGDHGQDELVVQNGLGEKKGISHRGPKAKTPAEYFRQRKETWVKGETCQRGVSFGFFADGPQM